MKSLTSTFKEIYTERFYENQGFPVLVDLVKSEHHRVRDVGCGSGANMRLLVERGHEVVGITLSEREAKVVQEHGFICKVWDVTDESLLFEPGSFDAILFSHVLEHVAWPDVVLERYLKLLRTEGGIYVALPNVLQFGNRWQFLRGRFRYTESGLMDRTHLRFFDFVTGRRLLEDAGVEVVRHFGSGQFPMGPLREWFPSFSQWVDGQASNFFPGLFAFHIIIVGQLNNQQ